MKKRGEVIQIANVTCSECGTSFPRQGEFRHGLIAHCGTRSWAFGAVLLEPHHMRRKHPRCWCCGAELGCERCSGIERELLCTRSDHDKRGAVWATKAAFQQRGPFKGQTLADYPVEWLVDYEPPQGGINDVAALVAVVSAGPRRY
jgi:hypothetical protein